MQKKLIAIAVAGALGAPALALAQASTVQIYGKATFEYSYVDQGPGRPDTDILQTPGGASVGFKGTEALGGGLSAWFQCESSADIRGVGQDGFCSRNSALGFKGGFGNVYVGRWDTPFKRSMVGSTTGGEDTGVFGTAFLLAGSSTGTIGGGARHIWKRRQSSMIVYEAPSMGGLNIGIGYSAGAATGATNATTAAEPRVQSLAATYQNGPLAIGAGYERHSEFGSAGGANDDTGLSLSATYNFGKVTLGGAYNEQRYDVSTTTNSKKKAYHLGIAVNVSGPHNIEAGYTVADDISGTAGAAAINGATVPAVGNNTGAKLYQISYVHKFSKRTSGRFGYVKLDNDSAASYNLGGAGTVTAAGQSQSAVAAYLSHNF